jgi:hypothetical protein
MWSRILHLGTAATIWVFLVILSTTLTRGANQAVTSNLAMSPGEIPAGQESGDE